MAHLVILEDDPDITDLYRCLFAEHDLHTFSSIPETLNYLDGANPDLTILDMHLPSGLGLDVLKRINTRDPLYPTQVIGVSSDDDLREEALSAGASAFVVKPFEIDTLTNLVRQALLVQQMQAETLHHRPDDWPLVLPSPTPEPAPTGGLRGRLSKLINKIKSL